MGYGDWPRQLHFVFPGESWTGLHQEGLSDQQAGNSFLCYLTLSLDLQNFFSFHTLFTQSHIGSNFIFHKSFTQYWKLFVCFHCWCWCLFLIFLEQKFISVVSDFFPGTSPMVLIILYSFLMWDTWRAFNLELNIFFALYRVFYIFTYIYFPQIHESRITAIYSHYSHSYR